MYSSSSKGWANVCGQQDPRPQGVRIEDDYDPQGNNWLAAVLRAESTGAGEDLVYLVRNSDPLEAAAETVLLRASGHSSSRHFSTPQQHACFYHSAMAAARSQLYLLGGQLMRSAQEAGFPPGIARNHVPLEVYSPTLDQWFAAASPLPAAGGLRYHALVANQQEGMLLALGGQQCNESGRPWVKNEQVLMYDTAAGSWAVNPSGCRWPPARAERSATSVSAVAVDPYTIMVLSSNQSNAEAAAPAGPASQAATVDLLDLRTWRWRAGAAPQLLPGGPVCDRGLVMYDGQVLAVGGDAGWSDTASSLVHAYDPCTDRWSQLASLPFGICCATPLVVRVPGAAQ